MELDIKKIAEELIRGLDEESRHFQSMCDGIKLLYRQIRLEAEKIENGREEIKHSESVLQKD